MGEQTNNHREKARLEAEILAVQLERARREEDAAQASARSLSSRYWFVPTLGHAFQSIAAGLVFSGGFFLLYEPVINAVREVTERKAKVATLDAQLQERQNKLLAQELNDRKLQLAEVNRMLADRETRIKEQEKRYARDLSQLSDDVRNNQLEKERAVKVAEELKQRLAELAAEYKSFAEASDTEKEKYKILTQETEQRVQSLSTELRALQQRAKVAERAAIRVQERVRLIPGRVFRDMLADGSEGPELVVLPTGSFTMGSPPSETGRDADEGPQHRVAISKPFAIGKYEVTYAQYDQFAEQTGRAKPADNGWGRGDRPVTNVTWNDAVAYADWLSEQTGEPYRLPTEAEWEYAYRGGSLSAYWWGNDPLPGFGNCEGCGGEKRTGRTTPVGAFKANPFDLFDVAGNVQEMVQDCGHGSYEGAPVDGSAWGPEDNGDCDKTIWRGGSWNNAITLVRGAYRFAYDKTWKGYVLGFRLAKTLSR